MLQCQQRILILSLIVQLSACGKLSADAQLKGAAASAIVSLLSWDEDNNGFLFA